MLAAAYVAGGSCLRLPETSLLSVVVHYFCWRATCVRGYSTFSADVVGEVYSGIKTLGV